jgi:hypothetical protein
MHDDNDSFEPVTEIRSVTSFKQPSHRQPRPSDIGRVSLGYERFERCKRHLKERESVREFVAVILDAAMDHMEKPVEEQEEIEQKINTRRSEPLLAFAQQCYNAGHANGRTDSMMGRAMDPSKVENEDWRRGYLDGYNSKRRCWGLIDA